MGGSISKIFGGGGSKPAPAPAPEPKPEPVKATRAERVEASRRRGRGTGYRGLLGAQRFGEPGRAGTEEVRKITLGSGS